MGGAGEIVEFDETFAGRVEGQPLSHKAGSPQTFGTETARSLRIGIRSGAEAHWIGGFGLLSTVTKDGVTQPLAGQDRRAHNTGESGLDSRFGFAVGTAHHCAAMVDKRLNEGSIEHVESRQHSASKCAGRGLRVWVQHHYGAQPAARLFCLRDAGRSRSSRSTCSVGYQRSR